MIRLVLTLGLVAALAAPAASFAAEKEKPKAAAEKEKAKAGADKDNGKDKAPAAKVERKCPGCGAVLPSDVTSCPACGTEVGAAPANPAAAEQAMGLCEPGEKALLTCELKKGGKTLSVCASKDFDLKAAVPTGTLAYRLGKPGKVELSWPEPGADAKKAFIYKNEAKQSGSRVAAASFEGKDGTVTSAYVAYTGQRVVAAGQLVTAKGKKKAVESECKAPSESALGDAVDTSFSREAFAASEMDAVTALLKK